MHIADEWVSVIVLIKRAAQGLEKWVAVQLSALPQDLGFAPRTHVMSDAHSHLFLQLQGFQALFWLPRAPTYTEHTPTHPYTQKMHINKSKRKRRRSYPQSYRVDLQDSTCLQL